MCSDGRSWGIQPACAVICSDAAMLWNGIGIDMFAAIPALNAPICSWMCQMTICQKFLDGV